VTPDPFFKEFALRTPRPVSAINDALSAHGIIGGYDLSRDYPHLGDAMLVCVTEMNTKADIDTFVAALRKLS
jgi:glycine dehydrogenase subunit 1